MRTVESVKDQIKDYQKKIKELEQEKFKLENTHLDEISNYLLSLGFKGDYNSWTKNYGNNLLCNICE
jgi:uncharacterized protein (UPF0335 family)